MQNGAYRLAGLSIVGGVALLTIAGQDDYRSALGIVLLLVAALLAGVGKGVEWLGYVQDGARSKEE